MIYHTRIQSHHQSLIAKTWRCKWMITNVATILTHPTLQLCSLHSSNDFECRVFLDITSWVVRYQYRLPKAPMKRAAWGRAGLMFASVKCSAWTCPNSGVWLNFKSFYGLGPLYELNLFEVATSETLYECFHCWSVFYCPCSEARKFPTLAEPKCLLHAIVSGQHLLPATSSVQFGVLTTSGLIMSVKSMRSVTARTSSSSEQCLPKIQDAQLKHFSKHCWNQ